MLQLFFKTEKSVRMFNHIFCVFLLMLMTACSDGGDGSSSDIISESGNPESETGTIAFTIENPETAARKSGISGLLSATSDLLGPRSAMADFPAECDSDIVEISAVVYDEFNAEMLSAGPWQCSAHSGKIGGVRPGTDRKLVLLAKNDKGDIIYRTEEGGITVTGGQTNEITIAPFESFVPDLTGENGSLNWQNVNGAVLYRVVIKEENSDTPVVDEKITTQSYTPQNLSEIINYHVLVYAADSYGNQSSESESYTIAALPVPTVPENIKSENGIGQATVTWDAADNADSYTVRYKASESDWILAGETDTTSMTVSDLIPGTLYTFSVQAVNPAGGSGFSAEISALPMTDFSGTWISESSGNWSVFNPALGLPAGYPAEGFIIDNSKKELILHQADNRITGTITAYDFYSNLPDVTVTYKYSIEGMVVGNTIDKLVMMPLFSEQLYEEYHFSGDYEVWKFLDPETREYTVTSVSNNGEDYLDFKAVEEDPEDDCLTKNYDGTCLVYEHIPSGHDYVKISDSPSESLVITFDPNPATPVWDPNRMAYVYHFTYSVHNPNPFPVEILAFGQFNECFADMNACSYTAKDFSNRFNACDPSGTFISAGGTACDTEWWKSDTSINADRKGYYAIWFKDDKGNIRVSLSEPLTMKKP